jgi:hypothetical protein
VAETCCDTERYNNINNKLLVAIAGICLKDSYVYITQQDEHHKDKKKSSVLSTYSPNTCYFIKYKQIIKLVNFRPLLWSSGQSSWLQIRRPGFDSLHYQEKK